jgi:hypothetical protein
LFWFKNFRLSIKERFMSDNKRLALAVASFLFSFAWLVGAGCFASATSQTAFVGIGFLWSCATIVTLPSLTTKPDSRSNFASGVISFVFGGLFALFLFGGVGFGWGLMYCLCAAASHLIGCALTR